MQEDRNISQSLSENHQDIEMSDHGLFDFSRLPWVIFLSILKFFKTHELCRLCLVNKQWRKACLDPSLWQSLNLVKYCTICDDDLIRLTSYCQRVAKLHVSQRVNVHTLTDPGVCHVLRQCPSLVECSIVCRELSEEGLEQSEISQWRKLSDTVLVTLGEHCHLIRKLDITLCYSFTDEGIKKVGPKCRSTGVQGSCANVNVRTKSGFICFQLAQAETEVCEGCPALEELTVDQCTKLTNEMLVYLGRHSKKLKYISAASIVNIEDQGVLALLQGCQKLETLRLPFCGLTGQSINHVAQHCVDIVCLDIRGVTLEDSDVHKLVTTLTKIETLNLGLCFNLTDVSVKEIALHFKDIKHLFLVNSKITDEGLFELSTHCRNLIHLDVSWCQGVTDDGAKEILIRCKKLKHLGLFRCDKVSELLVDELASQFPYVFISTLKTEMKKSQMKNSVNNTE